MPPFFKELNLSMAIQCILEHSKKPVLLLVDDIMKSGGDKEDLTLIQEKVTEICKCLDAHSVRFNAVLATSNILAMCKEQSRRDIELISLPPLTLEEATSLFGDVDNIPPDLQQCIVDCNGHVVTLELLKLLWNKSRHHFHYVQILNRISNKLDKKYSQLSLDLVRPALLGQTVDKGDSPDGKGTYGEYVDRGYYLKPPPGQSDSFVPAVTPIQLHLYACNNLEEGAKVMFWFMIVAYSCLG